MSQKKKKSQSFSGIKSHKLQNKTLNPPLMDLNAKQYSWRDDRLPEMLWGMLLVTHLDRDKALGIFRRVADCIYSLKETIQLYPVTHTNIGSLDQNSQKLLIETIASDIETKLALSPLLLLSTLPAYEAWAKILKQESKSQENWGNLMMAVARGLFHQSQEATDCRWAKVIFTIAAGKLSFSEEQAEFIEELKFYPNKGDLRQVRPSIRATELSLSSFDDVDLTWPQAFWKECFEKTGCAALTLESNSSYKIGTNRGKVRHVYELLVEHYHETLSGTSVDPKHDVLFGMAFYCLTILEELLGFNASQTVHARLCLRTLVECLITIRYLAKNDNPKLWEKFRVFGAGQAKLQFLKLDELNADTGYVNSETLQELANEDIWQEFLPINLGHWAKAELRKLSEDAGIKDIYDRYYAWSSSFTHGHWGAIRESVFDICGNPLHRLHRIPRLNARMLPDVIPDACELVDLIIETVSDCYPSFRERVTIKTPSP